MVVIRGYELERIGRYYLKHMKFQLDRLSSRDLLYIMATIINIMHIWELLRE
jgi:hypothetical protein